MAIQFNGTTGLTFPDGTVQGTASGSALNNRIINGRMEIDQRNSGASVTVTTSTFSVDRWQVDSSVASKYSVQQNAGSVTPPPGFKSYLGFTSLSAYTPAATEIFYVRQQIEGNNISDLAWGTASAVPVTLSFWVRSSLTGNFGGALNNLAGTQRFPFAYTINAANTWEKKSIFIPGSVTGTWVVDTGVGLGVLFGLGIGSTYLGTAGAWTGSTVLAPTGSVNLVGTNGATLYLTGVSLKAGDCRNELYNEWRPYQLEEWLCQRYYEKSYDSGVTPGSAVTPGWSFNYGTLDGAGYGLVDVRFKVQKRVAPTINTWTTAGVSGQWTYVRNGASATDAATSAGPTGTNGTRIYVYTGYNPFVACNTGGHWTASSEL